MEELLSDSQRNQLRAALQETTDAKVCRRCGALLRWNEGEPAAAVAREFGVTRQTLYNWRDRVLDDSLPLTDRPRCGRTEKWTAQSIASLEDALSQSPRNFGFQMAGWTSGLLKTLLCQRHGLGVSERSVRNKLHELGYVWKRFRYRLSPDPNRVKKTTYLQCYQ